MTRFITSMMCLLTVFCIDASYHQSTSSGMPTSGLSAVSQEKNVTEQKQTWHDIQGMPYAFYVLWHTKKKPNAVSSFKSYCAQGMPCHVIDKDGRTLMHTAASCHNVKMINYLHKKLGLSIQAKTKDGVTPLHYAVYYNTKEVITRLIELGAKPDVKDSSDLSPRDCLSRWNRSKEVQEAFSKAARKKANEKGTGLSLDTYNSHTQIFNSYTQNVKIEPNVRHQGKREPLCEESGASSGEDDSDSDYVE